MAGSAVAIVFSGSPGSTILRSPVPTLVSTVSSSGLPALSGPTTAITPSGASGTVSTGTASGFLGAASNSSVPQSMNRHHSIPGQPESQANSTIQWCLGWRIQTLPPNSTRVPTTGWGSPTYHERRVGEGRRLPQLARSPLHQRFLPFLTCSWEKWSPVSSQGITPWSWDRSVQK